MAETQRLAENAYPKTGGTIEGKLFVTSDIDVTGWIGGTTLHDRHSDGRWSRVYSEAHKPEPREIGVYSIGESDGRFALKKSHDMFSCGGVDVEAVHDWAGIKLKNANGYYVQLSATPHDKPEMMTVYYRDSTTKTQYYVSLRKKSGVAALESQLLGVGQQWVDVTSSRRNGTWYTNDTDRPIAVYVQSKNTRNTNGDSFSMGGEVDGVRVGYFWVPFDSSDQMHSFSFIVPPGSRYTVKAGWANGIYGGIHSWIELR
ncbi:hypothetical protein [Photorhabdus hainanensis]|uniref:hypothetical protein n=1 Tax=Photorhabdus hainanensis TaxID=1004166 RepID=UPI001BD406C8|nr:hypothetical protein [Photorhabdus hainanensis]MBS9431275.1 hypothetical protein [Photorhabdus hainanensis]